MWLNSSCIWMDAFLKSTCYLDDLPLKHWSTYRNLWTQGAWIVLLGSNNKTCPQWQFHHYTDPAGGWWILITLHNYNAILCFLLMFYSKYLDSFLPRHSCTWELLAGTFVVLRNTETISSCFPFFQTQKCLWGRKQMLQKIVVWWCTFFNLNFWNSDTKYRRRRRKSLLNGRELNINVSISNTGS